MACSDTFYLYNSKTVPKDEAQKTFNIILGLYDSDDAEKRRAITAQANCMQFTDRHHNETLDKQSEQILQKAGLIEENGKASMIASNLIYVSFVYDQDEEFVGVKSPFDGTDPNLPSYFGDGETVFVSKRDKEERINAALSLYEDLKKGTGCGEPEWKVSKIELLLKEAGTDVPTVLFTGQNLSLDEAMKRLNGFGPVYHVHLAQELLESIKTQYDPEKLIQNKKDLESHLKEAKAGYVALYPTGNGLEIESRREFFKTYAASRFEPLIQKFVQDILKPGSKIQVGQVHSFLDSKLLRGFDGGFSQICSEAGITPEKLEEQVFDKISASQERAASLLTARNQKLSNQL